MVELTRYLELGVCQRFEANLDPTLQAPPEVVAAWAKAAFRAATAKAADARAAAQALVEALGQPACDGHPTVADSIAARPLRQNEAAAERVWAPPPQLDAALAQATHAFARALMSRVGVDTADAGDAVAFAASVPRAMALAFAADMACAEPHQLAPRVQTLASALHINAGALGALHPSIGEFVVGSDEEAKAAARVLGPLREEELRPAAYAEDRRSLEERSRVQVEEMHSTHYLCPNPMCPDAKRPVHQKKGVSYYEQQTRALDEAATVKCRCLACNRRFNA